MRIRGRLLQMTASLAMVGAVALAAGGYRMLVAADHFDPPLRTDPNADTVPDAAADIADIYLFHTADDLVMALTFAGPQATTLPAVYDPDLVCFLHLSNDGDARTTEFPIRIQFGRDPAGNSGVRITGLPGGVTLTGPVETDLQANGIIARAGLFDDPFFFDSRGLRETRATGTLSFDSTRDFFSAQNITIVVIQIPLDQVRGTGGRLNLWSEALRFGGQL